MKIIRVACFGLQGFGNDLISALFNKENVELVGIYTRETTVHPFVYYECDTIESIAKKMNITASVIPIKGEWNCCHADLAIVSSFHRIFKQSHLVKYRYIVNIHPSLLPMYKGATPTNWMIKRGERIVGLTAHLVTEEIDAGTIIFQRRVLNPYLSDNQLRKALSFASRSIVSDILDQYPNYEEKPQRQGEFSLPARTEADAIAKVEDFKDVDELICHIKAFTNFPMPKIEINNRLFVIDYENPVDIVQIEIVGESFNLLGYWLT